MKKSNIKFGIAFGASILVGICVIVAVMLYFPQRVQAVFSRPLVLIHNPINYDQIEVGEGITVHATARNDKGITQMELWVDGELIKTKTSPEGVSTNPFVMTSYWQPTNIGKHILLVRAYSADEIDGQATITIEAVESTSFVESHIVEEGETLESIAEDLGTTEEELSELNPDLPSGGPTPGDTIEVPSGSDSEEPVESRDEGEAPPSGESTAEDPASDDPTPGDSAPAPADAAPGTFLGVLDFFLGIELADFFDADADMPRNLLMEILSFETNGAYEDTNCYISLGEGPWDVAELEGATTRFMWPGDQELPFEIACVGIAEGGTDSVNLGHLALQIHRDLWDGVTRAATSDGVEGSFTIEYRITQSDDASPGFPAWLDENMTPPTRLHLDGFRQALRWEYYPEVDEEPIRGFAIYLNGTLQWTEHSTARLSDLPPEWLHPPCGEQHVFTVSAFGDGFPDGPESPMAYPPVVVETHPDDCEMEFMVTFYDLITHELGGDGDADDRTGDLGPVHGYFFANEERATFDTGSLRRGLDIAMGITDDTTYDLEEFAASETRSWYGRPSLITEVPEGETLLLGFHIMDEDSGRCNWDGDPDCDDLVCDGETFFTNSYDALFTAREGRIISDNGRCEVTFRVEPSGDTPIGSPGGWTPAPSLSVQNVWVDDATGNTHITVKNIGTATWPYRDLEIEEIQRSGERINLTRVYEFVLEPGASTVIPRLSGGYPRMMDRCIVLDPNDQVIESVEISGAFSAYRPYCPNLPDLVITDVEYDASGEQLLITVRNAGIGVITDDGALENRTVEVAIPAHSRELTYEWNNVTIAPRTSTVLVWPGITEDIRSSFGSIADGVSGYIVTIDPRDHLAEENEDNNDYHVEGGARYWLSWQQGCSDYFERWRINHIFMYLTADVVGGDSSRRVADWAAPEIELRIPSGGYSSLHDDCWGSGGLGTHAEFVSEQFYIRGDEELVLHTWARLEAGTREWSMGDFEFDLLRGDEIEAFPDRSYPLCNAELGDPGHVRVPVRFDGADESGEWVFVLKVCRYGD